VCPGGSQSLVSAVCHVVRESFPRHAVWIPSPRKLKSSGSRLQIFLESCGPGWMDRQRPCLPMTPTAFSTFAEFWETKPPKVAVSEEPLAGVRLQMWFQWCGLGMLDCVQWFGRLLGTRGGKRAGTCTHSIPAGLQGRRFGFCPLTLSSPDYNNSGFKTAAGCGVTGLTRPIGRFAEKREP
jgi:hypothetical protein